MQTLANAEDIDTPESFSVGHRYFPVLFYTKSPYYPHCIKQSFTVDIGVSFSTTLKDSPCISKDSKQIINYARRVPVLRKNVKISKIWVSLKLNF
jgi:hypothetical protein